MTEYKVIVVTDFSQLEEQLNKWGKQGWEIDKMYWGEDAVNIILEKWVSSRTKIDVDDVRLIAQAGEWAYKQEVVDTQMEEEIIGKGKEYADKEDWIQGWLSELSSYGVE